MIRLFRNIKLFILLILFILSSIYASIAYVDLIAMNDYPQKLTVKSIKLNKNKVYLFTKKYSVSLNQDTLIVPIGNKNLPDSLCYLYYDNEWKIKLSSHLRNDNQEKRTSPILPWCCTQESSPHFFAAETIIPQSFLETPGIKFNYYTGTPNTRLSINLLKDDSSYYLKSNLQFIGNSCPLKKETTNIIELDFCINADTIDNKYIFSFPFLGKENKPERNFLKLKGQYTLLTNSQYAATDTIYQNKFEINNILFEIKDQYPTSSKVLILLVYISLIIISFVNFFRLFKIHKSRPHRNLVLKEESNILSLRILFNSIILLGVPILIISTAPNAGRTFQILILLLFLNVNWFYLFQQSIKKHKPEDILKRINHISKEVISNIILVIILITILLISFFGNYEQLFNIPIIHITKLLYILLPFTLHSDIIKSLEDNIIVRKLNILKLNIAYILILLLSVIILLISKDFATPLFTIIALIFITILQKGNIRFIWSYLKTNRNILLITLLVLSSILIFEYESILSWYDSKVYRFASTIFKPDYEILRTVSEQSKQTISQQIYLLKASFDNTHFWPQFRQPILPTFRSTFFSDYSILWSFRLGNYFFLSVYFFILIYLSYCIISLLVLLNNKLRLKDNRVNYYNPQMIFAFNVLLSLFLVQYIYTFLSNLWVLPLTGQSPGVLSPSICELIFHILLINAIYLFINKRNTTDQIKLSDKPRIYLKEKKKAVISITVLIVISLVLWSVQVIRIRNTPNEMKWAILADSNTFRKTPKDSIESRARLALEEEEIHQFRILLNQFYNHDNSDHDTSWFHGRLSDILFKTSYDSLRSNHRTYIYTVDNDLTTYNKAINSFTHSSNNILNNPLYSGCPLESTTVNFSLQKELNLALQKLANEIESTNTGHYMFGGSILVCKNNGEIAASASYPLLYNENEYHLQYIEKEIRQKFPFRFKYFTVNDYVNFSEYDAMPGSIVKPLLAYFGLKYLDNKHPSISASSLNKFIGKSDSKLAYNIFKDLAQNHLTDTKEDYINDFKIYQFYDLNSENIQSTNSNTLRSYAIGQQNKLTFKKIVQAYTRIKTGKKILYSYKKTDTAGIESISLEPNKLVILHAAMNQTLLKGGTAITVGNALKNSECSDYTGYLAKTGTAEYYGNDRNKNRSSSFIIVTNDYTIGIQLLGILPNNNEKKSAKALFIEILETLKEYGVLHES